MVHNNILPLGETTTYHMVTANKSPHCIACSTKLGLVPFFFCSFALSGMGSMVIHWFYHPLFPSSSTLSAVSLEKWKHKKSCEIGRVDVEGNNSSLTVDSISGSVTEQRRTGAYPDLLEYVV